LGRPPARPEVVGWSDEPERRATLARAEGGGRRRDGLGRAYLGARGYGDGCLAILGFEGGGAELAERHRRARALVRDGGALAVGRSPGEAWLRSRFSAPYLRDELLTHGILVETLETAAQWSRLDSLHGEVG